MHGELMLWGVFWAIIATALYIDLGVLNKRSHVVSMKEAAAWSAVWLALALLFDIGIWHRLGGVKAMEFLTGYVLEKSLSVDNMFVFIVIFRYFAVPREHQSRVLHWGILGALVMRLVFILAGVALISAFHWIIYVFGFILIYTGIKMLRQSEETVDPAENPALKLAKRFLPFSGRYDGQAFFSRAEAAWCATPLFAALLVVEVSDVVFALDSIPAVLAITQDPLIVYTSNVFAILGLRALFFLLAGVMGLFRFLKVGISVLLCYVGLKMCATDFFKIPVGVSLAIVVGILALSVLLSVLIPPKGETSGKEGLSS